VPDYFTTLQEREKVEGEGMALVFIEDSYFGFLTIVLNQQETF
jgi:hypothetical protein